MLILYCIGLYMVYILYGGATRQKVPRCLWMLFHTGVDGEQHRPEPGHLHDSLRNERKARQGEEKRREDNSEDCTN